MRHIFFKGLQGGEFGKRQESEVVKDLKLLCRDQLVNQSQRSSSPSEPHTKVFCSGDRSRCLQSVGKLIGLVNHDLSSVGYRFPPVSCVLYSCWYQLHYSGRFPAERLIVISQNPRATLADLAAMLLSNLSVSAAVISAMISMKISVIPDGKDPDAFYPVQSRSGTCPSPPSGDAQDVLAMPLLVDAFVQGALVDENQKLDERRRKGELHFLASLFANVATVKLRGSRNSKAHH